MVKIALKVGNRVEFTKKVRRARVDPKRVIDWRAIHSPQGEVVAGMSA